MEVVECIIVVICCLLLFPLLGLVYEVVRDTLIGPRFIPCTTICALLLGVGIYLAINFHIIWLILISILVLPFYAFVAFVHFREYSTHEVIARCKGTDFSARMLGSDAKASISFSANSVGTGYSGDVYFTPSTRHMHINYSIEFEFSNGKKKSFSYNDIKTELKGKYGTLKYKRIGWYEFTPYEDQEKGKAIFESEKRK